MTFGRAWVSDRWEEKPSVEEPFVCASVSVDFLLKIRSSLRAKKLRILGEEMMGG